MQGCFSKVSFCRYYHLAQRRLYMTDIDSVDQEQLFDRIAADYDLLLADWKNDLLEQGRQLDGFIRRYAVQPVRSILDCTCGIGTQCIGLAKQGYRVTGTDISRKSIERARREAKRFNVDVQFQVADIRVLAETVAGRFDCVISCDNSLPALLTEVEIRAALGQMYQRLATPGLCVISIRDYRAIFKEKKRFHPRQVHATPTGRLVVFDLWEYPREDIVVFNVFYLREGEQGWSVVTRKMVYRALYPEQLVALLAESGFKDVDIIREVDGDRLPFDFYLCRK